MRPKKYYQRALQFAIPIEKWLYLATIRTAEPFLFDQLINSVHLAVRKIKTSATIFP